MIRLLSGRKWTSDRFWPTSDDPYRPERRIKNQNQEDIDICLHCTKVRCSGTSRCFANQKNGR